MILYHTIIQYIIYVYFSLPKRILSAKVYEFSEKGYLLRIFVILLYYEDTVNSNTFMNFDYDSYLYQISTLNKLQIKRNK